MTIINQRISKAHSSTSTVFTLRREYSSRYSLVQVGQTTNNVSYPHEDTSTISGHGGNGSGAPRMRIGRDADRTWETCGEQATKETKIQECQISEMPLATPLALPDSHLPGIFSAQSFSERSRVSKRRCRPSRNVSVTRVAYQGFQKQTIWVHDRMPTAPFRWLDRNRQTIDQLDQRDKE